MEGSVEIWVELDVGVTSISPDELSVWQTYEPLILTVELHGWET